MGKELTLFRLGLPIAMTLENLTTEDIRLQLDTVSCAEIFYVPDQEAPELATALMAMADMSKPWCLVTTLDPMVLNLVGRIAGSTPETEASKPLATTGTSLFLKQSGALKRVELEKVTMLKSDRIYLEIFTIGGQKFTVRESLSRISHRLDLNYYRVNRSLIVNLNHLFEVGGDHLIAGPEKVGISRKNRQDLLNHLKCHGLVP
jgi:DNA-binding LytR/AlgR family response regulator